MTKYEVYEAWAPPEGAWSAWAKPVLFAHVGVIPPPLFEPPGVDVRWAPSPDEWAALVLELPGPQAVLAGIALARKGYRPVPLFNACPAPLTRGQRPPQLVDVDSILGLLVAFAPELRDLPIALDAAPVFLIDANRCPPLPRTAYGAFDNRSVHFATDFPSATYLIAHGVQRAVWARDGASRPREDLRPALRGWQRGGIILESLDFSRDEGPQPLTVPDPGLLGEFFRRLATGFSYRLNALGGFGGIIPEPSSSTG